MTFASLAEAKIFSKFDLKVGFYQLGIHPKDRPKKDSIFLMPISNRLLCPLGLKQSIIAPKGYVQGFQCIMDPYTRTHLYS